MISGNPRFAIIAVLLAATALFVHSRAQQQDFRLPAPVSSLPLHFGEWNGADVPFSPKTLASVGPGQFVQRSYRQSGAIQPDVDLYLAYHANRWTLRNHLPNDCLIGSGWSADEAGTTTFVLSPSSRLQASRYLITRGSDRQLVLFWFWVHGRNVASDSMADVYLTLDSLRLRRSDFAIVRINTPLAPGEKPEAAQQRLLSFAARLDPLLNRYL